MSQELSRRDVLPEVAKHKLNAFWKQHSKQIMAVTAGSDVERIARVTYSMLHRNPKLIECSPFSLLNGIVLGHQLGLTFGTQEISLVPFKNEATVIIGYQGKAKLALLSGVVTSIECEWVHIADEWQYWRDENGLHMIHRPNWAERTEPAEDNLVGSYCQMKIKGGGIQTRFVSIGEILKARARSRGFNYQQQKGGTDNPWITDFGAMSLKTAAHRACKLVPQTPALATSTALEDAEEGSGQTIIAEGLDMRDFTDAEIVEPIFEGSKSAQADVVAAKAGTAAAVDYEAARPATISRLKDLATKHPASAMAASAARGIKNIADVKTEEVARSLIREIQSEAAEEGK